MEVKRICAAYWSATGNTDRAVNTIAEALAKALDVPLERREFTRPADREQMLTVSGVGTFKYEKYGEQFLETVRNFTRNFRRDEGPDSLGAVDFSSLDYDVAQDYEEPVLRRENKEKGENGSWENWMD